MFCILLQATALSYHGRMTSEAGYTLIAKYTKMGPKTEKCIAGHFAAVFLHFVPLFLLLRFTPRLVFVQKFKGLCGVFFHSINKTRN